MNTAQVSIELVLAGILALCAFALPFWTGSDISADLLQSEALIGILGIAYLLGVIFDKLADTVLTPMEHFLRLKQADKYLDKKPGFKGKDPFPQNELEFKLKRTKDGRLEWMDSLKSRMRTSRELAVLGLPATMGIVIHEGVSKGCGVNQTTCAAQWLYVFVALNLLIFIVTAWLESKTSDEDSAFKDRQPQEIKTDDLVPDREERARQLRQARKQMRAKSIPYYLLIANSTIAIALTALIKPDNSILGLIGASGLIVSLLALWTCLRITRTYIKFVAREMPEYLAGKEK